MAYVGYGVDLIHQLDLMYAFHLHGHGLRPRHTPLSASCHRFEKDKRKARTASVLFDHEPLYLCAIRQTEVHGARDRASEA